MNDYERSTILGGIAGLLASQGVVGRIQKEVYEEGIGPCTCDVPPAFYLKLLANYNLRAMMIAQGEDDGEGEESLLEWYRTQKERDGCGSRTCRTYPVTPTKDDLREDERRRKDNV
jgi:hypothetical protein